MTAEFKKKRLMLYESEKTRIFFGHFLKALPSLSLKIAIFFFIFHKVLFICPCFAIFSPSFLLLSPSQAPLITSMAQGERPWQKWGQNNVKGHQWPPRGCNNHHGRK